MVKRFFVALIVGLIVMSSQLAAAEDFDWSQAKRIVTKAEFANYIESERCKGHAIFHLILTKNFRNEFGIDSKEDFANLALCIDVNGNWHINNDGTAQMTYEIKEYSGTHVANAYLSGNTSNLNSEEQNLYELAVGIVNEANKRSSEIEKARYIHDEICRRVKGYKDENERNKTAIGALIDHYAHCQGFTDAFYMLGRMCGLDVVRIGGTFQGESHAWNFITFSDGKAYCVDVTGTFNSKTSMELLTFETMKSRYWCEWEIIPNLQRT